jgi:2-methylcitrate dehydratase
MAAFANTSMIRAWDWNDGLYARLGGHASDMISAFLAVGEVNQSSPEEVISAIILAYEVLGALGDWPPKDTNLGTWRSPTVGRDGWEQGLFLCPAAAVGLGKLIGLDRDQLAVAIAQSILPGPQLGQARGPNMSKACATGESMRRSIFAVTLAKEGFTCRVEPFEGRGGLWEKVTGPFERAEDPRVDERRRNRIDRRRNVLSVLFGHHSSSGQIRPSDSRGS